MSKFKKPHLACDMDLDKVVFPIWVQYKIDGVRGMVQDAKCTGRSLKAMKNKKLTAYFSDPIFDGMDFEIGATHPNDPDLCRLTTSLTGTIEGELPKFIVVFDYLTPELLDYEFSGRMAALEVYYNSFKDLFPTEVEIYISPRYRIDSMEQLIAFYEDTLSKGYEGIIKRDPDGKHKNGRATVKEDNYLRLKPKGDAEGTFIRCEEAMKNNNVATTNALGHTERSSHKENKVGKGMIGAFWIKDLKTGQEIKIGAGKMNHDDRKYYFEHQDELADKLFKYNFLDTGAKDVPRHARFHSFRNKEDL